MTTTEGQLCPAHSEDTNVITEFVTSTRELLTRLVDVADPLRAADLLANVSYAAEFLMLGQIETLALQCSASFRTPQDAPRHLEAIALLQTLVDAVERTQTDTGMEAQVEAICRSLGAPAPPRLAGELPDDQRLLSAAMAELFKDEALGQLDKVEAALLQAGEGTQDPELLHGAFRAMHSFKGNCGCVGLFELEEVAHRTEDLLDDLRRGRCELDGDVCSVVLLILDTFRESILNLGTPRGHLGHKTQLLERLDAVQRLGHKRSRGMLPKPEPEPERASSMKSVATQDHASDASRFVRVDVTKLDALLHHIGELISASASVVQSPDLRGLNLERFQTAAGQLARITAALHDTALAMRMIPLEGLFCKMTRIVRNLRQRTGKRVDLLIQGERTELERSVMESIADPLAHIIRNAVDHGIESESERRSANKPGTGTIRLTAEQRNHEVWITIEDDGRGIDPQQLVESAIRKGLIARDRGEMSVEEAYRLMFLPGLSTARDVTYVSGRGVGMDVVHRHIAVCGGRVEIRSEVGLGSTFIIRLPLASSIIDAMAVMHSGVT